MKLFDLILGRSSRDEVSPIPAISVEPPESELVAPVSDADRIENTRRSVMDGFKPIAAAKGVDLSYKGKGEPILVTRGKQRFIVAAEHFLYACDFCNQFEYYFSSVKPVVIDGFEVADFSQPGWHVVPHTGDRLFFTSMAEDIGATLDYIKYLQPKPGDVVLDVGAYCGLSALTFSRAVGQEGVVITIEPDPRNFAALELNLQDIVNVRA
jgi:hypothetical protein